jgi:hypothetical protein
MPLDQSVMFDGGWRVLSGQVPFRDFSTLTGVTPLLFQAFFFRVLGVTWFAYCVHAAIFNGLFCILVYLLLRALKLTRSLAFFYALLSALGFYPPIGTPYMEQHGFFFLLLALVMISQLRSARRAVNRNVLCLALPLCLLVIWLSKQNLAAFAVLPLLAAFVVFPPSPRTGGRVLGFTALGCLLLAGVLIGVFAGFGVPWERFLTEYVVIPLEVGRGRTANPVWFLRALFATYAKLVTPTLILIAAGAALMLLWAFRFRTSGSSSWMRLKPLSAKVLFAASLVVFCMLFAKTTLNQAENAFPFVFLALGVLHSAATVEGVSLGMPRFALNWVTLVLLLAACRDAALFTWLDETRQVNDIQIDRRAAKPLTTETLKYMVYQVPGLYSHIRAEDVDGVVGFLQKSDGNFLLVGDFAILYGAAGKPSVLPSLWYHAGMTSTMFREKYLAGYEEQLMGNVRKYQVRYIVEEQDGTFVGIGLKDFPKLEKLVRERAMETRHFGGFRVVELDTSAATAAPPR